MNSVCKNCGSPLSGSEVYCTSCGAPVANTYEQTPVAGMSSEETTVLGREETTVLNNGFSQNGSFYNGQQNNNAQQQSASNSYAGVNQSQPGYYNQAANTQNNYGQGYVNQANGAPNSYGTPAYGAYGNVMVRPQHGFAEAYKLFWQNYVNFSGRSRRSDYWYVVLWNMIIGFAITWLAFIPIIGFLILLLYFLATLLPMISLSVRRLQDSGNSGLLFLLNLIPLVGQIILIVLYCKDSDYGANEYGESPKYFFQR